MAKKNRTYSLEEIVIDILDEIAHMDRIDRSKLMQRLILNEAVKYYKEEKPIKKLLSAWDKVVR